MKLNKLFLCTLTLISVNFKVASQILTTNVTKIDGKLNEWTNIELKYNRSTKLYYAVTNDDDNLYLLIKSTSKANINKINGGGISFFINTKNFNTEKGAYCITFPNINKVQLRSQMLKEFSKTKRNSNISTEEVAQIRKEAVINMKEIKVVNFNIIKDTLISIYNEYGIRCAVNYDSVGSLCYELAVPFKQLNIVRSNFSVVAYKVQVNAVQTGLFAGSEGFAEGSLAGTEGFGATGFGSTGSGKAMGITDMTYLRSPTNFWGKYTLK